MQKIIINADDFGINHEVNQAIMNYINRGIVTSTSIMAGGEGFEEATSFARSHPQASYGVHLYLCELKPIVRNQIFQKYGMLDADGCFKMDIKEKIFKDPCVKESIYQEWRNQIVKIQSAGVPISHIDSHHHIHTNEYLMPVIVKLSKEFGIKKARLNSYLPISVKLRQRNYAIASLDNTSSEGGGNSRIKYLCNFIIRQIRGYIKYKKHRRNYQTVDCLCLLRFFWANSNLLNMMKSIEIEAHPGYEKYQEETNMLEIINWDRYELITYNQLGC